MTRDYWREVLDYATLSAKDRTEIENKYYDAERAVQLRAFASYIAGLEAQKAALGHNIEGKIAIAEQEYAATAQRFGKEDAATQAAYKKLVELRQQLADQRQKIADIEAKAEEARAQHNVNMERIALDQRVAMREISAEQVFTVEQDLENQLYAQKLAALQKQMAAEVGGPNDPVAVARINAQIEALDQQHQEALTKIANDAEKERMKVALQAVDEVENRFATFFDDIATRTKSFKDAFKDLIKGITDDLTKLASQEVAKQLFGPGTAGGGFLKSIFGSIFGQGGGAQVAATTANTTAIAALTAAVTANTAAVSASAASGVGGSIFGSNPLSGGGIFGDFGSLLTLDTGTPYVPSDTLAFVHKGEAVVPAKYNRAGANLGGLAVHNQFVVNGQIDSRTQDQIAAAAGRAVNRAASRIL
jgi:hypothetical protein